MGAAAVSGTMGHSGRELLAGYRSRFAVAEICVEMRADDPEGASLSRQLLPFSAEWRRPGITVELEWQPALRASPPPEIFHSGCVWRAHQSDGGYIFDFVTSRFGNRPYKRLIVDENFRRAIVELNGECLSRSDGAIALEYPLDELLVTHHLSLGLGAELHGCGLIDGRESYLFVGHSGAGKSTTARLWTSHASFDVLSDDRIIVRRRGAQFFMYGTPWHGEAEFAAPRHAPLRRIFLLEHGGENRIERLSAATAVGELLARSFTPMYHSRFVEPVLTLLEQIASSVPCYRFHFVPDQSAVEIIRAFRD